MKRIKTERYVKFFLFLKLASRSVGRRCVLRFEHIFTFNSKHNFFCKSQKYQFSEVFIRGAFDNEVRVCTFLLEKSSKS